MLPKRAIEEYKEIYFKVLGVRLSDKEATKKAIELMDLFKIILRPRLDKGAKGLSL